MYLTKPSKTFNCMYNEKGFERKIHIDNYWKNNGTFRISIEETKTKKAISIRMNLKRLKAFVKFIEKEQNKTA